MVMMAWAWAWAWRRMGRQGGERCDVRRDIRRRLRARVRMRQKVRWQAGQWCDFSRYIRDSKPVGKKLQIQTVRYRNPKPSLLSLAQHSASSHPYLGQKAT